MLLWLCENKVRIYSEEFYCDDVNRNFLVDVRSLRVVENKKALPQGEELFSLSVIRYPLSVIRYSLSVIRAGKRNSVRTSSFDIR